MSHSVSPYRASGLVGWIDEGTFIPSIFWQRTPKDWRETFFLSAHSCKYCKHILWGKGSIGHVYGVYDVETWRAHTACRVMEVLSGED